MDSSQITTAFGTGRISQQPLPYPLEILPGRTQASASAVDIEAHRQPSESRMLQRRGLRRENTEQDLDDTAAQRRHSHRRNIALHLAALNALTYLSLSLKHYQLPHTTNWEYKTFEKLITVGERSLSDWFEELSDVAFDIKLSEYIDSLSVEDINLSINDVKAAQHYESLIDGFHRMYLASTTHCTLVQKAKYLDIPQRFDYCEGIYQEYVAAVLEEDQTNRKRLKIALNRADQLLSAIRTAMVDESLDDTNLARLKTKLTALQIDYPEAYQTVYGGPQRDLFDPGADRWWNTSNITAQKKTTKTRSTLSFIVPTCCLLSCIPAFMAWRCSPPGPGTTSDSTFYELLAGCVIQALGLGAMLWPALSSKKLNPYPRIYSMVLAATNLVFMLASVPMYLWVSVGWGPAFAWVGAVAQALVLLQLTDEFVTYR